MDKSLIRHPSDKMALNSWPLSLVAPGVFVTPLRLGPPTHWLGHCPLAFWLVESTKPRTFVELGTNVGVSYSAFAQGVLQAGLYTQCYGIDPCSTPGQDGISGEALRAEWEEFHQVNFREFSRLLRSTAVEAASQFDDASVDILHLDGQATAETIRRDCEAWLPKLSDRALVLLHRVDRLFFEGDGGAGTVWRELRQRYPTFTFTHSGGLGLAAVGASPPPAVVWLTGLEPESQEALIVQRFFATLGDLCQLASTVDRAERHGRELDARATREMSAAALAGTRFVLQATELTDLRRRLDVQERRITQDAETIAALRSRLDLAADEERQLLSVLEQHATGDAVFRLTCRL